MKINIQITLLLLLVFFKTSLMQAQWDDIIIEDTPTEVNNIILPPGNQTSYNVNSNQSTTIKAKKSITLRPGVWIKPGSNFKAYIILPENYPLSNQNYIRERLPQNAVTSLPREINTSKFTDQVTYYDGLGRAIQKIGIQQSGNQKDLVTHISYDRQGRMSKEYLPYVSNRKAGSYIIGSSTVINAAKKFYRDTYPNDFAGVALDEINPYVENLYEYSPEGRIIKQGAPGKDWKANRLSNSDHTKKYEIGTNTSTEVAYYYVDFVAGVTTQPSLKRSSNYAAKQLIKSIVKDENWKPSDQKDHTTEIFKDKLGREILKRTYVNQQKHDTYSVYDDYNNLTYVLPPAMNATSATITVVNQKLNKLGYQYRYDHRNRLIEKNTPDVEAWLPIVYNKLDAIVLSQDANQKELSTKEWSFTKYDVLGRAAYTGIYKSNKTRTVLQSELNQQTQHQHYEKKATTGEHKYTSNAFPTSNTEVLTVNYYDNYEFDLQGATPKTVYGVTPISDKTKLKGLTTGVKVRVLDTNNWITTVTYYDQKSRPIYIYQKNTYLNSIDQTEVKYDFVGKVLKSKSTHVKDNNPAIVTEETFTYDPMGRLLSQQQSINGKKEAVLSNTYNQLGQLKHKIVGGGLQTVDYDYNVRGWLKSINKGTVTNGDLFGFVLNYNTPNQRLGASPLYNGNISETIWKTANIDNSQRSYGYQYDGINRITAGIDNTSDRRYSLSSINYDKNGNITNLIRKGQTNAQAAAFGVMDKLTFDYDTGNKLLSVTDTGIKNTGFRDGNTDGDDYIYDANKNMITDKNKNITRITYNHLNLPKRIEMTTGIIEYVYDATGGKLKKSIKAAGTNNGPVTEYVGSYIYKKNSNNTPLILQFFNHSEGYIEPNGTGFDYVYQFTDHLGNVRLSYKDANKNGTITQNEIIEENNYYPFGLKHKGYNNAITSNNQALKYKYNGKELEDAFGLDLYEMDMRQYDATIGRWTGIDPVIHHDMSTYNAFDNNPIFYADPSGADSDGGNSGLGRARMADNLSIYNYGMSGREVAKMESGNKNNAAYYKAWFDRYKLGEDGSITYYDNKGGDAVDYLIFGNEETKVADTSILPQLESNSFSVAAHADKNKFIDGFYAISSNHKAVKNLFLWAAKRVSNEWSYIKANTNSGLKSFISTSSDGSQAVMPSSGNRGFGEFTTIENFHSHYGTALHDFQRSDSDQAAANFVRINSPKAKFFIYSPLLNKAAYNSAIGGKYRYGNVPYKPINYEPAQFIPY